VNRPVIRIRRESASRSNSGSGYLLQPRKLAPGDETGQGGVGAKEAVAADGNSVLILAAREAVGTGDIHGRRSTARSRIARPKGGLFGLPRSGAVAWLVSLLPSFAK
jgi:hypothetical protein